MYMTIIGKGDYPVVVVIFESSGDNTAICYCKHTYVSKGNMRHIRDLTTWEHGDKVLVSVT